MTEENARQLSQELQIDISQIVRENWEMTILKEFFDSNLAQKIIFKGGTALRLAYNSPRFSEDLDFSLKKAVSFTEFKKTCQKITQKFPKLKISDLAEKFYTLLCEFKIKEEFLPMTFSIKIEISKRKVEAPTQLKLLTSPVANLQVLAIINPLEKVLNDKIITLKSRKLARDYFDIWYICEYLKKPMPKNLPKIAKNEFRRDLGKFLPASYRKVTDSLEERYAS